MIFQEETERKEVHDILKALYDLSPVGMVIVDQTVDEDGNKRHPICSINKQALEFFGYYVPAQVINDEFEVHDFLPAAIREHHRTLIEAWFKDPRPILLSTRNVRGLVALRKDGEEVPVCILVKPFPHSRHPFSLDPKDVGRVYGVAFIIIGVEAFQEFKSGQDDE